MDSAVLELRYDNHIQHVTCRINYFGHQHIHLSGLIQNMEISIIRWVNLLHVEMFEIAFPGFSDLKAVCAITFALWWRHDMETLSAPLLLWRIYLKRGVDIILAVSLKKLLIRYSSSGWFQGLLSSCDVAVMKINQFPGRRDCRSQMVIYYTL